MNDDAINIYPIRKWDIQEEDIEEGDRVYFPGYDTGKLTVLKREGDVVLIRESGRNFFLMRGQYPYSHPSYRVGFIKGNEFHMVEQVEYSKETAKEAKEKAMEIFIRLNLKGDRKWVYRKEDLQKCRTMYHRK